MGPSLDVLVDASPWGLGGVLLTNRHPVAYFKSPLTMFDEVTMGHSVGASTGQQTWEAFAVLVAVRAWRPCWVQRRVTLSVTTDSAGSSHLLLRLKTKGRGPGIVAREFRLTRPMRCTCPTLSLTHRESRICA